MGGHDNMSKEVLGLRDSIVSEVLVIAITLYLSSIVATIYPADKKDFRLSPYRVFGELIFALEFKPQDLILEPSNFKKV